MISVSTLQGDDDQATLRQGLKEDDSQTTMHALKYGAYTYCVVKG